MEKNKFITAYLLRVDEEGRQYRGYLSEVENSLKAEQKYVGGYIQVISLTDEIDAIIADEGKLMGLPANRLWRSDGAVYDFIVGNIACVRHDEEGNFTSIHPEDIPAIESVLVPIRNIIPADDNTVFITYPADCLPEWKGGVKDGC